MNRLILKLLLFFFPSLAKNEKKNLLIINILLMLFFMLLSVIFLNNTEIMETIKIENAFLHSFVNSNLGTKLFKGYNVNYSMVILTFSFILTFLLFLIVYGPIYCQMAAAGLFGTVIRIVIQNYNLNREVLLSLPMLDYTIKKVLSPQQILEIYIEARDKYLKNLGIKAEDLSFFHKHDLSMLSSVNSLNNKEDIIKKTEQNCKEIYDLYLAETQNTPTVELGFLDSFFSFLNDHWFAISVTAVALIITVVVYKYGFFDKTVVVEESDKTILINNANNVVVNDGSSQLSECKAEIINSDGSITITESENRIQGGTNTINNGQTNEMYNCTNTISESEITVHGGQHAISQSKVIIHSGNVNLTIDGDDMGNKSDLYLSEIAGTTDTIVLQNMENTIKNNSDQIKRILEILQNAGLN